jgi:uncharacterized protein involved in oxidation of intracellular sulfur
LTGSGEKLVQTVLIVINGAPYGSEKACNTLRLAIALQARNAGVKIFLMADAVFCALPKQEAPQEYYKIGEMLSRVISNGAEVAACGSCMKARGLAKDGLLKGAECGSMAMFSEWTESCDMVPSF